MVEEAYGHEGSQDDPLDEVRDGIQLVNLLEGDQEEDQYEAEQIVVGEGEISG